MTCRKRLDLVSMDAVRVPRAGIPVFHALAVLDEVRYLDLIGRLSTRDLNTIARMLSEVRSVVGDVWSERLCAAFVTHMVSMATLRTSNGFDVAEMAEHLASDIDAELDDATTSTQLTSRLRDMLTVRSLAALGKAVDISQQADRMLHIPRIITDTRPVFDEDAALGPIGAVIQHTLRVEFLEDGEYRSTSFTLTPGDLRRLKVMVERAEIKEASLAHLLDQTDLTLFDLSGDRDD